MMAREKKEEVVKGLKEDIDKARALFVTNLIGVSSNDAVKIRKSIRDAKGKVVVTRNTLFKRAAQGTYLEEVFNTLKGPNAVAFAFEDAPGVAKALYDAGQELDIVQLKSGFLGEKALSASEVVALAKLPSRDQMLATLLATFNAPVSAFVRTLNAIREQKETGGSTEVNAEA